MESRRSSTSTVAPPNEDFLRQMAHIRDKLRKRFLRRPLYLEAAHSYEVLASKQERLEFPEGAAMAYQAAANVYTEVKRLAQAAENYTKSARIHLASELEMKKLCMPSIEDNLINGLEAYHRAIVAYEQLAVTNKGSSGMVGSLCYEAGSKLQTLERYGESLWFLEKAVENWKTSPSMHINCLQALEHSQVKLSEMEMAEQTCWEIESVITYQGDHCTLQGELQLCHISLVLLQALLKPPRNSLSPQQRSLHETYSSTQPPAEIDPDLFLSLQSLWQCIRERCTTNVRQIYENIVPYCEPTQMYILDAVLEYCCPFS